MAAESTAETETVYPAVPAHVQRRLAQIVGPALVETAKERARQDAGTESAATEEHARAA